MNISAATGEMSEIRALDLSTRSAHPAGKRQTNVQGLYDLQKMYTIKKKIKPFNEVSDVFLRTLSVSLPFVS